MNDQHGIWQKDGQDIEHLPDPLPSTPPPPADAPPPTGPSRRRRIVKWSALTVTFLLVVTIIWLVVSAPLGRALEPLDQPAMLLVSAEGRPIARRGAIKEAPVEVARLDPLTPAAFIAIEDKRFRSHWGVDPRAIGRAFWTNARAGSVRQGGSTLTQQLAKTSFLSSDRSLKRKAQEVIIAFWLEGWLTKDEILSRYLSSVYFGDGVYGLRAASLHYFGRAPERLTLAQSAMLAGLVQAPSRLAPTRHLAAAQKRSRLVLQLMADQGVITQARARGTTSARVTGKADTVPTGTYFADWVSPAAEQVFTSDYGRVTVPTTLDADLQRAAVRAVAGAGLGKAQAALVAMRPDGRVVAMVGGKSYADSPFNRAVQARRQPGSAFKLFVYLAALRAGYTPNSMVEDRPVSIDGWSPKNSDGVYRGTITLREAFARSSNAATVRLSEAVGRRNVIRTARDLGITAPLDDAPSLALGTSTVSLLELTQAYAAVASGAYPVKAHGLMPVAGEPDSFTGWLTPGGRLDPRRDWSPMLDLLWSAANEGTGRRAALSGYDSFGKTGTTQDNRDAIFVGFAGNLVVGVWVGRDDNASLGKISGGTTPATIWRRFMGSAMAVDQDSRRLPAIPFRRPEPPRRQSPVPEEWREDIFGIVGRALDELFQDR